MKHLLQKLIGAREWLIIHDPILFYSINSSTVYETFGRSGNIKVFVSKTYSKWLVKYKVLKFVMVENASNKHSTNKMGVAYAVVGKHNGYKWVSSKNTNNTYNLLEDKPHLLMNLLESEIPNIRKLMV